MRNYIIIFLFGISNIIYSQVIFNHDYLNDINGWSTYGNVSASWVSQGANTSGSAQIEVLSTNGNINQARFFNSYTNLDSSYEGKILLIKVFAKSDTTNSTLRIKAELHNAGAIRNEKGTFTLTNTFEKYILPIRIKDGDTDFRFRLEFGTVVGTYNFDDISLEYVPYDFDDIQQTEPQINNNFQYEIQATIDSLPIGNTNIQISIDTTQKIAPVLATQIGVNSNFRSKNSLVNRAHLYESFGAFRYPAGSGSDIYFWDGNIPNYLSGYSGTANNFLNQEHYVQFIQDAGGHASIVVNYAYARLGETPQGTREARVSQAASYAAGFVKHINTDLSANAKYWEVGNESYGAWETGYNVNGSIITGKEYGEDFCVFVDSMKLFDPNIKIGAVFSGYDWNRGVLKEVGEKADYLIIHNYLSGIGTVSGARYAISTVENNILKLLLSAKEYTTKPFGFFPIHITEYNSQGYNTTTMANGLFTAYMISTIIKNRVNLATIWVNEWSVNNNESHGILSKNDPNQNNYTARPSYIPYYYYPKYFGNTMVQCDVLGDDDIVAFASTFPSGEIGIVVMNYSDTTKEFSLNLNNTNSYDLINWFEIYADNINEGNTKFYVNGETSTTIGGGPEDLDLVKPYRATYQQGNILLARPYSLNFISLGNLPVTEIISQPYIINACIGDTTHFEIQATGQNLSYQWQKNAVDIQNATNSFFEIQDVNTLDTGVYTCVVSGDFGYVISDTITLSILEETVITTQPNDLTVNEGEMASFSAIASGSYLSYQWSKDNINIIGATNNILIINNVQQVDAGIYQLTVIGDCGQVVSQPVGLNVLTKIEDIGLSKDIKIYPNPSTGVFNIYNKYDLKDPELTIFDIYGKEIISIKHIPNTIDLSNLKDGFYILNIKSKNINMNFKILKQEIIENMNNTPNR